MSRRPPHQNTRHQYAPRLRARACMGVVAVVLLVCVTCPSSATFTVYWNSPTQTCHQFGVHINVSAFGIVQNTGDLFYGDKVSIFYGPGAFPYLKDDQPVNGGIPQNGSLQDHLHAFTSRVQQQLPTDFSGVAVLDFEAYYPSLAMSPPPYHEASRAWVAAHYPHLPPSKVFFLAEQTFNESAREFFETLLWVGRELRPKALWGYYHYPYCHNYGPGVADCKPWVMEHNNDMSWLVELSTALYPSIYIFKNSGWDPRSRRLNTRGRLLEAIRMRHRTGQTMPILPYFWYRYHDSASFLSPLDTVNTMGFTKMLGLEGAVVWGSTSDVATKSECLILKRYVEEQLGPLVRYLDHLPRATLRFVINSRRLLKRLANKALRAAKYPPSFTTSSA